MRFAILAMILLVHGSSFAKGRGGTYLVDGILIDANKKPIAGKTIYLQDKKLVTDSNGKFEYKVLWQMGDKPGFTQRRQQTKALNPASLRLKIDTQEISIENHWKRLGKRRKRTTGKLLLTVVLMTDRLDVNTEYS